MNQKLILLDCDGTLTNGCLYYIDGHHAIAFHSHDGLVLSLICKNNHYVVAIISGSNNPEIKARANHLGIKEVHLSTGCKKTKAIELQNKYGISPSHTLAIGDDANDLGLFQQAHTKVAVANAHMSLKKEANFITNLTGGNGAVREALDHFFHIPYDVAFTDVTQ